MLEATKKGVRKIKKIENKNLEKTSSGWFVTNNGLYSLSNEEIDRLRAWGFKIDFGGFLEMANLGRRLGYLVLDENSRTAPIHGVRTILGPEQQNVGARGYHYIWPFLYSHDFADTSTFINKK